MHKPRPAAAMFYPCGDITTASLPKLPLSISPKIKKGLPDPGD